jgi:hypothetical protein
MHVPGAIDWRPDAGYGYGGAHTRF